MDLPVPSTDDAPLSTDPSPGLRFLGVASVSCLDRLPESRPARRAAAFRARRPAVESAGASGRQRDRHQLRRLRADALGVYGYPRETSPEIDAFAGESIVFDHAYTVAPVTPTSFAAAFTGLLPHRVFHDWDLVIEIPSPSGSLEEATGRRLSSTMSS